MFLNLVNRRFSQHALRRLVFAIPISLALGFSLGAQTVTLSSYASGVPTVTFSSYAIPSGNAYPYGIAAGPDGALWFTELVTSRIGRITTAGVITEYTPTTPGSLFGITAGPDGALWISDAAGLIRRITTNGVITEFPGLSGGSAAITAGPDGALWFTEYAQNAIGRITTTGTVTEYLLPGSGTPASYNSITAGPDGALWFTDYFNKAVGRITTSGVITEYAVPNSSGYMLGIVTGPDGALWFTDVNAFFIGRVTTSGVITEYSTGGNASSIYPTSITVGPNGLLWFTDYIGRAIGSITTSGVVTTYTVPTSNQGADFFGIARGSDGALWFTAYGTNKIERAAVSGSSTCSVNLSAASVTLPSAASTASVDVTAAGCIWTAFADPSAPWIRILGSASGSGNGSVSFSVDANLGALSRTGVITIAGQTFTITQTGLTCFYSYGPTSQNLSSSGGSGSFNVSAPPGCPWTVASGAPFISAPSPLSGSGNGPVNYTVSQNAGSSQRTGIISITGAGFSGDFTVIQAPAGSSYACSANAVPATSRLEGVTELAADLVLQCSGTSSGAVTGDLQVTLNAGVTSRTFDTAGTSEALVLLNEPSVPTLGVNAFRGKIAGSNTVVFRNIQLRPASGSQTMRITNLRVNASQLRAMLGSGANPAPVPITALIQMNATVAIPIAGQQQTVAFAKPSIAIQQGVATPGSDSTTQTVALTFTEQFATAFKQAIASGQDPSALGQIYNSESGFLNTAQFGAATGRADTATRLRARITNIPTGTCVYAAVFASAGAAAQLVSADANGAGGTFVPGSSQFGGTYQQLTCSVSTATATWEVTSTNPLSLENSSVTLLFQNAGTQISQIQIATSLAPVTQDKFSAAGSTVPVPRFIDNSVPIPILVLRATSTVSTPGTASTSRPEGLRPLALSGGIVNITDLLINDSASMAPNVVTHTNLPPSLTLPSNACATPPAGTIWICDPDGHGLTILHGSVAPHTPVTFSFSATIDPGVLSGALVQVTTNASSDLPVDPNGATSTVTFTVESPACSAQISPSSPTQIPASGGSLSFPVSFQGPSCPPWTANANQIWITLPGGSYFTTPATVTVQAPANTGPARSAVLTIADKTVTINQAGGSDVRDFGGNGHSGMLLYDPSNGQSYTLLSNGSATFQSVGNLFTPAFDILRTGDFNGDGKADLVVYNSHTALAYLGLGNGDGTFAFQSLFWSPGYDFVETGDLNGDGKTDFALYNSSVGTMYTAISNGSGGFIYKYTLISRNFTFVRLADFTGDGKADIFLYRATDGVAYLGVGDGAGGFAFNPLFISPGYNLADIGDLNGDGKADVILYNPANGNAATGLSNGSNGFAFSSMIFSPGFTSVRLADYTGDGKADLTVYNKVNAAAYFGTGTGTGTFNFQSLFWSPGYDSVVPEDVNGDGKMDVLLYSSPTGTEYTGISSGSGTFSYTYSYWGIGKVLAR